MATTEKKFSELTAAGTLAGTEIVAVTKGGNSRRTTTNEIANTATSVSIDNTGLGIYDTDASHKLTIQPASNITANRTLQLVTGDASRIVTFNGDATLTAGTMATLTGSEMLTNKTLGDVVLGGIVTATPQTLSGAGAIDVTHFATHWTTTSTDAGTLADGSNGQLKLIVMVADGGDGTLTPSNFGNGTTITFDDVGDAVLLYFIASNWWVVSNTGCTVA